jgi:peptide subunit release factor 1 (eRF1)
LFANIDLRKLAELSSSERVFLSVYLSSPESIRSLPARLARVEKALSSSDGSMDEREHLDRNVSMLEGYLEKNSVDAPCCLFVCWALDYFRVIPLTAAVRDSIHIDRGPYIRPLAELQDEYENVAVVLADNKRARVHMVSSAVAEEDQTVHGNVKNHVRKGGWSQQRYERRRDKQLHEYAKRIVEALEQLSREESFRRIVLAGGREIMREVYGLLPQSLRHMVAEDPMDLHRDESSINSDLMEDFERQERASERDLWSRIREEYLRGGLGMVGMEDVLAAAKLGQVESVVVDRGYNPRGTRCRDCEALHSRVLERCPECGSRSLYEVGLINELVLLLETTSASIDFVDPIETLAQSGKIAALLRYRIDS